jgi:branched-chain amino acid transport system substrate-binding protein
VGKFDFPAPSRRRLLAFGGGLVAGAALPVHLARHAWAADEPPIGTYPAGIAGDTVTISLAEALTGTYAGPGADERSGYEMAAEHINNGDPLLRAISPRTTKGILGKQVKVIVGDSVAHPNTAVQLQSRFITEDKPMMMGGAVSSAVAVALNKLAQREKVLYLPGLTGSNDTTGKDCVRYCFRQCFYGYTAAAALSPVLIKTLGTNKKVSYLIPDYTYGHTVHQSFEAFLKKGGWTTATAQVAPLGAPDYSSYMLNIVNSGADVFININFGNDAVLSIKQAQQFGVLKKQTLVIAYNTPYLAKQVGPNVLEGVYAATDWWWTLEDRYPLSKMFVAAYQKKYGYTPDWAANSSYMQTAMWANMVETAGTFYPPKVIQTYESGIKMQSTVGEVYFRAADHQLVRPVIIQRGKKVADMKTPDDYYDIVEVVPGEGIMQPPDAFGCKLGSYT